VAPALAIPDWTVLQGQVVWWLSFVVGALVGGYVVGLAVQALTAMLANQKLPPAALWLIRILAGIVCGWLLALALSGHGLPGTGPGGGSDSKSEKNDSGQPNGSSTTGQGSHPETTSSTHPVPHQDTPSQPVPETPGDLVTIEVLSRDQVADPNRCYRVAAATGPKALLDLGGVVDLITHQTQPRVRQVKVILYKDSPAKGTPRYTALMDALHNIRTSEGSLKVGSEYDPIDAPR
jgi:hypothetical protein